MQDIKEKIFSSEIKNLVPVLGKENAVRLSKAYLLADEDTRKRIIELVDVIKAGVFSDAALRDSILLEPPPKKSCMVDGIEMGNVLYGKKRMYPLYLPEDIFLTHIGIFGSSGYGKTNISYWLIKKLSEKNIPIIIFDFSKRNYKDLLSTPLKDKIEIYTVGRNVSPLRFNPLKPPEGIQMSQWIKEFSTIFDHAYWLLGGGRHIIMKAFSDIIQSEENPRLSDLKVWVKDHSKSALSTRERNWLSTAERPLESLCFRELGEVFDCDEGINLADFFKKGKITILELDSLDTNDKTFLIEIILQWLRDMLLVNNEREKLKGVVILEEAHHILNREKSRKLGTETVIDLIFREVRELGMGIVYIDQHPSLLSYPALGNTSTHIYMNLGLDTKYSSDIMDAVNMLGLDYDEQKHYLRKLPVGQGFMLCRRLGFSDPFLFEFNKMNIKKGSITDEDIRKVMKDKVSFDARPKQVVEKQEIRTKEIVDYSTDQIDESGWKILKIIVTGKGSFTSQIYKELKMSGSVFNKRVTKLLEMGILSSRNGRINRNKLNYFFLTDVGRDILEKKFGSVEKKYDVDLSNINYLFQSSGWEYIPEKERLMFNKQGKMFFIQIVSNNDRDRIYKFLINGINYFLCANETTKNLLIQEAARFSQKNRKELTVFISTTRRFEQTNNFEKIQF